MQLDPISPSPSSAQFLKETKASGCSTRSHKRVRAHTRKTGVHRGPSDLASSPPPAHLNPLKSCLRNDVTDG